MKQHTIISNKIYVKNACAKLYWWCKDNLVIDNPLYLQMLRLGKEDTIRYKNISPKMSLYVEKGFDLIIPFGCLYLVWDLIEKNGTYETRFNDNGTVMPRGLQPTYPMRDYQEKAVQAMIKAKGGVLIGSCGSGKTNCGIEIMYRLGKKSLWLTHTTDLLNQTIARIRSLYPDLKIGTITDGKVNIGEHITVSTVQTMATLDTDIYKNDFDVIIADECHKTAGSPTLRKQFIKVFDNVPARYKYGLTASKERNDSLTPSMYATIGSNLKKKELCPVYEISKKETNTLTSKHVKVELNTKMKIETEFGEKIYPFLNSDGTFDYSKLTDFLANNEERNNTIVEKIVEYDKENRKQLVLCNRTEQCKVLVNKLVEKGIKAVLLTGKVTDKKRKEILNREIDWDVIVATTSLAKEGLDITELSVLHLTSIVSNKSDTVQAAGRIERVCENKPEPHFVDYVDINLPYCVNRWKKRHGWLNKRF